MITDFKGFKGSSRAKQMALGAGAILGTVSVCVGLALFFMTPKAEEKAPGPESITRKEAYAALFRSIRADRICYDEGRNAYFVHFPEEVEGWEGWHYIDAPQFYKMDANGTWFVAQIPDDKYVRVYPDVNGMPCANAAEYEGR